MGHVERILEITITSFNDRCYSAEYMYRGKDGHTYYGSTDAHEDVKACWKEAASAVREALTFVKEAAR
jgi:hypothetical protein